MPNPSDHEVKKRIGESPFTVCRNLLASRAFARAIINPLSLGHRPVWQQYSPDQLTLIAEGLSRHFKLNPNVTDLGGSHITAMIAALESVRFARIFDAAVPALGSDWLHRRLTTISEPPALRLAGRIEHPIAGTIEGFALDLDDPERPLDLDIFLNDTFAGTVQTVSHRRDAQEHYGGDGNCGFVFNFALPTQLASLKSVVIHVFERASGESIGEPIEFMPVTASYHGTVPELVSQLSDLLNDNGSTDKLPIEVLNKLQEVSNQLPDMQQYASIPLEHYGAYRKLFRLQPAGATVKDLPSLTTVNTPDQVSAAKSELILVCPEGVNLSDDCAVHIQMAARENPDAKVFYGDLIIENAGDVVKPRPIYRAGFDPDTLLADPAYACAFAVRRSAVDTVGGLTLEAESAVYFDLWLRVFREFGQTAFCHAPEAQWHPSTPPRIEMKHAQAALERHLSASSSAATTGALEDRYADASDAKLQVSWPLDETMPLLAIIIPTRDSLELIKGCIDSIRKTLAHPEHTEILIMDNGSQCEDTRRWLRTADNMDGIRVILHDAPFNWSAINNRAVAETEADYLLFLNNDTLALDHGWDTILRGQLNRPDIGLVGSRLLFEDGTIQYGGYILHPERIVLKEAYGQATSVGGYCSRSQIPHSTSAIIGAFMGCRRSLYEELEGFDEEKFAVAFNDVDFSLAAVQKGYRNLYCPQITFMHLESKSRGYDAMEPQKAAREQTERQAMQAKWGEMLSQDPWYPRAFLATEPTHSLLAAPRKDCISRQ